MNEFRDKKKRRSTHALLFRLNKEKQVECFDGELEIAICDFYKLVGNRYPF